MRGIEGMNGSETELLVVTGPVVERREREIIEHEVTIKRISVEPELISEAYSRHVRSRSCGHRRARKISIEIRVSARQRQRHIQLQVPCRI